MDDLSKKLKRRSALKVLGSAGLAGLFGYGGIKMYRRFAADTVAGGSVILGGKYRDYAQPEPFAYRAHDFYRENFLYRLDLRQNSFEEIASKTPAHSTDPHPLEPNLVLCSSRRSDRASLFDWKTKKEISSIITEKDEFVFGHGAFTEDGRHALIAIIDFSLNSKKPHGLFYVVEVPSLKKVDVINAGEFKSHDISQIGGDIFVSGTLSERPGTASFGVVDFKNRKFQGHSKKIENFEKYLTINHVKKHGSAVYGLGNVFEDRALKSGTLVKFDLADNEINLEFAIGDHGALNEVLSIEYDNQTDYVWMTVPTQNAVIVWDAHNDRLVNIIKDWPLPTSVIRAPFIDAMLIGTEKGFKAFDRKTFKNRPGFDSKWEGLNIKNFAAAHTRII